MPIEMTLKAAPHGVPVRLWTDTAQSETLDQLKNVAGLPITYSHVAAMPDVHYGRGATVGSVIATRGAIIPAAVGVDIGCGMHAVRPESVTATAHRTCRTWCRMGMILCNLTR